MSPMPRLGRKVAVALLVPLLAAAAFFTMPALAQDTNETPDGGNGGGDGGANGNATDEGGSGTDGNATGDGGTEVRTFLVRAQESGCPDGADPCWDMPVFGVLPGDTVRIVVDLEGSAQPHDFTLELPDGTIAIPESPAIGGVHTQTIEIPEDLAADGTLEFVCSVHDTTMVGFLGTPTALTAGVHVEEVPHMGVHFLAYWVGLIAFALLFLVYGVTFFLFKYNETSATTDHWDRTGAEGAGKRVSGGKASLLAVVIAVAALAVIIYVARAG